MNPVVSKSVTSQLVFLAVKFSVTDAAFSVASAFTTPAAANLSPKAPPPALFHSHTLKMSTKASSEGIDFDDDEEEEEEIEPGNMRVSEIKAELELRKVDFTDCFDRESLVTKLAEARATGRADPSIIDEFNKKKLEETFNERKLEINDEDIEKAVGGDGTLPGGMPPEMLKSLMSNPELMTLLQTPKMQDVMKLMMSGGQEALEEAMSEDQETFELVMKLNKVMDPGTEQ